MKVRIYQPHTHNRVRYTPGPKGIALDVSPGAAAYLKQHGVLDPPKPALATEAAEPELVGEILVNHPALTTPFIAQPKGHSNA